MVTPYHVRLYVTQLSFCWAYNETASTPHVDTSAETDATDVPSADESVVDPDPSS